MGIRQLAMSPEPEEKTVPEPSYRDYGGYKPYPSYSENDYGRYDGNYDGSKYKEEKEIEDRKDLITIRLNITYREIGKTFFDEDNIPYDNNKIEIRVKELAYDRIIRLVGKGFESKYSIELETSDCYDDYEVEIILTPLTK